MVISSGFRSFPAGELTHAAGTFVFPPGVLVLPPKLFVFPLAAESPNVCAEKEILRREYELMPGEAK